ncbi:MAG TPA: bifunctional diaminohydroxyphosphoribosylaminopyrimidine deaminase/5-amino-6-(5-phosphoribosylamino)uracil reductase RibD [Candidatus Polarisedimenticolia bacterium]|nr:bifunctional diaminohydroxyphosphoribosylaminopyrimidine deaminase/5-amino-6-(5-phosphoribosylamino)uracil reductase RibD [Candidatus Polarisedimenticolia bacterium]
MPGRGDLEHMARCLHLAARAAGRTRPNPMVGAVVARGGRVVSEAWHRRAGGAHAEVLALRRAGPAARGATLYANLEPCCHYGRTPPCVEAILAAGIRRVVASHRDPFPMVDGRGFAALRAAGVRVEVGPMAAQARELNGPYLTSLLLGRPFVEIKAAVSLDGRIATRTGESRWISSPASRMEAHRMRSRCDAILVGARTVARDDPLLTVRLRVRRAPAAPGGPLGVVLDSRLVTSPAARLLAGRRRGSVIIYGARQAPARRVRRLAAAGALVVPAPARGGRVSLPWVLEDLLRRGVQSLLIEGGGEVIASALEAGVVDRMTLFVAPVVIGGRDAVPLAGGKGVARLSEALRARSLQTERRGPDLVLRARFDRLRARRRA